MENLPALFELSQALHACSDAGSLARALAAQLPRTVPCRGILVWLVLGKEDELISFYRELGNFLKRRCKGSTAFIYFGDRKWIPYIGLKPSCKKALKSGGLDGRLAKFEMY